MIVFFFCEHDASKERVENIAAMASIRDKTFSYGLLYFLTNVQFFVKCAKTEHIISFKRQFVKRFFFAIVKNEH